MPNILKKRKTHIKPRRKEIIKVGENEDEKLEKESINISAEPKEIKLYF